MAFLFLAHTSWICRSKRAPPPRRVQSLDPQTWIVVGISAFVGGVVTVATWLDEWSIDDWIGTAWKWRYGSVFLIIGAWKAMAVGIVKVERTTYPRRNIVHFVFLLLLLLCAMISFLKRRQPHAFIFKLRMCVLQYMKQVATD